MTVVEKAIQFMENTANDDSHGYSQSNRWSPDYDCSSLVFTAWEKAGVPVKTYAMQHDKCAYTGNLRQVFLRNGFRYVTEVNLKTGDGLKRGDVLLCDGKHVAMYCGNGKEVEASINEKGKTTGGKTGDQTGKEILIRPYRNYPWKCVLRYLVTDKKSNEEIAREVIKGKWGNGSARRARLVSEGYDYGEIQKLVNRMLKG